MKKVVVATDSFKGSLSSREVADAFELGFCAIYPNCKVFKVGIADGGEGTIDALVNALGGDYIEVEVCNPLHRPIKARYGIVENGKSAIIEMSTAGGLALLKAEERNPLLTSTYGTGEMIADAIKRGCHNILLGIGGSATNDGGTGLLRALGFRFLDHMGRELVGGGEILEKIAHIDDSQTIPNLSECQFTVACDVTNPLYGREGAAFVFAPQKGADIAMVEQLDRGLRNYAQVIAAFNGVDISNMEGAGAAGGLGGGLKALLNAQLVRGIDMILSAIHFEQIVKDADIVITGEGQLDRQTLMGKAPSGVLKIATELNIPTIAIGGKVVWCEELRACGFDAIEAITPEGMTLEEAMRPEVAKENVRRTAEKIAKSYTTLW